MDASEFLRNSWRWCDELSNFDELPPANYDRGSDYPSTASSCDYEIDTSGNERGAGGDRGGKEDGGRNRGKSFLLRAIIFGHLANGGRSPLIHSPDVVGHDTTLFDDALATS